MEIKHNNYQTNFNLLSKSGSSLGIFSSDPFCNCQVTTYGAFCSVLAYPIADQKDIIIYLHENISNKTQLLIDVRDNYADRVETLFAKNEIIFKQPYVNNTGSRMIMYMIQKLTAVQRFREEKLAKVTKPVVNKVENDLKAKNSVSRSKLPF